MFLLLLAAGEVCRVAIKLHRPVAVTMHELYQAAQAGVDIVRRAQKPPGQPCNRMAVANEEQRSLIFFGQKAHGPLFSGEGLRVRLGEMRHDDRRVAGIDPWEPLGQVLRGDKRGQRGEPLGV